MTIRASPVLVMNIFASLVPRTRMLTSNIHALNVHHEEPQDPALTTIVHGILVLTKPLSVEKLKALIFASLCQHDRFRSKIVRSEWMWPYYRLGMCLFAVAAFRVGGCVCPVVTQFRKAGAAAAWVCGVLVMRRSIIQH
jgi:hypothetical protein